MEYIPMGNENNQHPTEENWDFKAKNQGD